MSIRSVRALLLVPMLLLALAPTLRAQEAASAKKPNPAPPKGREAAAPRKGKGSLKPVDINSATKNELAFMLGLPEPVAAKIVAGRPYPTKARLLTQNIVSAEVYAAIKDRIIARQTAPAPKR